MYKAQLKLNQHVILFHISTVKRNDYRSVHVNLTTRSPAQSANDLAKALAKLYPTWLMSCLPEVPVMGLRLTEIFLQAFMDYEGTALPRDEDVISIVLAHCEFSPILRFCI